MTAGTNHRVGTGIALVALAFAGLGFWLGRRTVSEVEGLRDQVAAFRATRTVGGVASAKERAGIARAYDDPGRAEAELDDYTWQVPNMPTPFVGVAPRPGQHANAHINPQQMRHPAPLEIPKPPDVFRVFVTGGSTAFGTAAPSDAATITGFLQEVVDRELAPRTGRRYEIVNAANPAWTSTHERILIENRLSELEPDLVVSFSGNNEAHFGYIGLHVLWFRTYSEQYFTLLLSDLLAIVGDGPFSAEGTWNPKTDEPVPPDEVLRRLEKNLRLASAAMEPTGAPYVYVLQPTLAATGKELSERELAHLEDERLVNRAAPMGSAEYFRGCYALFRERLPQLELPGFHFVDASDAFDARTSDEEIFLDSYHFGDRGNRLLAERLFELIRPWME